MNIDKFKPIRHPNQHHSDYTSETYTTGVGTAHYLELSYLMHERYQTNEIMSRPQTNLKFNNLDALAKQTGVHRNVLAELSFMLGSALSRMSISEINEAAEFLNDFSTKHIQAGGAPSSSKDDLARWISDDNVSSRVRSIPNGYEIVAPIQSIRSRYNKFYIATNEPKLDDMLEPLRKIIVELWLGIYRTATKLKRNLPSIATISVTKEPFFEVVSASLRVKVGDQQINVSCSSAMHDLVIRIGDDTHDEITLPINYVYMKYPLLQYLK